jgi:hypothetical protein
MSTRLLSRLPSLTARRTPFSTRFFSSSPPASVSPQPPVRAQVISSPIESLRHHDDAVVVPGGWLLKDAQKLKNKVVLITGSGDLDGFGGKLALEAAHYGAKVVVSHSSEQGVAAVVEEIMKRGGYVVFLFFILFLSPSSELIAFLTQNCYRHFLRLLELLRTAEAFRASFFPLLTSPSCAHFLTAAELRHALLRSNRRSRFCSWRRQECAVLL